MQKFLNISLTKRAFLKFQYDALKSISNIYYDKTKKNAQRYPNINNVIKIFY